MAKEIRDLPRQEADKILRESDKVIRGVVDSATFNKTMQELGDIIDNHIIILTGSTDDIVTDIAKAHDDLPEYIEKKIAHNDEQRRTADMIDSIRNNFSSSIINETTISSLKYNVDILNKNAKIIITNIHDCKESINNIQTHIARVNSLLPKYQDDIMVLKYLQASIKGVQISENACVKLCDTYYKLLHIIDKIVSKIR